MKRLPLLLFVWACAAVLPVTAWAQAKPRELAPGVLQVIPLAVDTADTYTVRMPLPDLDVQPYTPNSFSQSQTLYSSTRDVVLFRDIWQYEFAHLGLRQIEVDVPVANNRVAKRNVWYLVYRIRNVGKTVTYDRIIDSLSKTEQREIVYDRNEVDPSTLPGRFFPVFTLVGWVYNSQTKQYERVEYTDEVLPTAAQVIQMEEDPATELLDSVEMAKTTLALSKGGTDGAIWGVATWVDVEPRLDYVSIRIDGLTNAYRVVDAADGSIGFRFRELQLNFFRPGDTVHEQIDRITAGIPLVDSPKEQVEIARRYELPGPLFQVYETVNEIERIMRFEADAQIDLDTFVSPLAISLNEGKLPEALLKDFQGIGVDPPADMTVETLIPSGKWGISVGDRRFEIVLTPVFWERLGDGIRLIKQLDYFWTYR